MEWQRGNRPPPCREMQNHWDFREFECPSKGEIESIEVESIDLGVHDGCHGYGYVFLKNGQIRRVALRDGFPYVLPYAPFVSSNPHCRGLVGRPSGLPSVFWEVCFYYLKPFVDLQVSPAVASLGGRQDLVFPQIWNGLFREYEFIHWAVLETCTGRCFYDRFGIRSERAYLVHIAKTLYPLLMLVNNQGHRDSKNLNEAHWAQIICSFGNGWCSVFKFQRFDP
jgi:hypothetical protein